MLLVEQNAALALDLADHAYVLETGRVVMSGPVRGREERRERPQVLPRLLRRIDAWNSSSSRSPPASPTAPSMPASRWRW